MIENIVLAAALWPQPVIDHCLPPDNTHIVGIARGHKKEFLYCEWQHKMDETSWQVDYVREGKIFATKKLRIQANPFTPEVIQQDLRTGEKREAIINSDTLTLSYQEASNKKMLQSTVKLGSTDVIDAGFDNFIRSQWDRFSSGKPISVNFASPMHQRNLPLRIVKKPIANCIEKAEPKIHSTCFVIEVDNALMRLVLGDIKLIYNDEQALTTYSGIVNLQSDRAENLHATIRYHYLPQ